MKTPHFIPAGPLLAVLLFNILLPSLQLRAAPAKENTLIDFTYVSKERDGTEIRVTKNYEYVWGAWDKHTIDIPKRGVLIQAPINDGQLGEDSTMVNFDKTPNVELIFSIGNANKAVALNFYLADKDGTEQQWKISLEGLVPGNEYHVPLDLTKCTSEQKPGKNPGMNLKKIYTWRIQGDWSKSSIEVLLVKLVAPKKG